MKIRIELKLKHTGPWSLEALKQSSCSWNSPPSFITRARALSISAQANDFSWFTNFFALSEAWEHNESALAWLLKKVTKQEENYIESTNV